MTGWLPNDTRHQPGEPLGSRASAVQDCWMAWESYVALGDSFTEGMDDPYDDSRGYRGWADLVAGRLAVGAPEFRYANLAVRGRLFDRVVSEQVPAALAMKPALVSFAAGGN